MKKKIIISSIVTVLFVGGGIVGFNMWSNHNKKIMEERNQFAYWSKRTKICAYLYCELKKIIYADILSNIDFYNKKRLTYLESYPINIKYRLLNNGDFQDKDVYYKPDDLLKSLEGRDLHYHNVVFNYYNNFQNAYGELAKFNGTRDFDDVIQALDSLWYDVRWFYTSYSVDNFINKNGYCDSIESVLRTFERHIDKSNSFLFINKDSLNEVLMADICKPHNELESEIDILANQFNQQVIALYRIMLHGYGIGTVFDK